MQRRQVILLGAVTLMGCKGKQETSSPVMMPKGALKISDPSQDPTVRDSNRPDPVGEMVRQRSLARLRAARFTVADSLPTGGHRAGVPGRLRSQEEIARRLLALAHVVAWVAGSEDRSPSEQLRSFARRAGLDRFMARDEKPIATATREEARRKYSDTIGWRMENMWPLAWVLGFEQEPAFSGKLVGEPVMKPLLDFLPRWETDPAAWIENAKARPSADVVALEDLFYCAHNAGRSAQLGDPAVVPEGFDPILDTGAIHERRHSLSWAVSPGIEWDDTDLST